MSYKTEDRKDLFRLKPRQGFFVQFRNQKPKGIVHQYHDNLKMALVSFQIDNNQWGQPEACDSEDLLFWTEGKRQIEVLNPCFVMFECWKGCKCYSCPYQDKI